MRKSKKGVMDMSRGFCAVFVLLTLFVTGAPVEGAKLIRVPQHVKSIQAALDSAQEGDTVLVSEGIYKGPVIMRDDIVLMGMSAERTVLRGGRKKPVVTGAQGAVLSHFTIEGGYTGVQCENTIMTIENCVIKNNRTGVHCVIALPIIRNNIVFRNNWTGIFCETTRTHRGRVANNVIAENGYCGVMLAGQSQVLVENNVFYFNKQYGIFTSEGAKRSRIVNNNFFGNRSSGNQFSAIDQTNLHTDPGYDHIGPHGNGFWSDGASAKGLKGSGGDDKIIGTLKRTFYSAQPFDNDGANQAKNKKSLKSGKNSGVKPVVCTEDDVTNEALDNKEANGEAVSDSDNNSAADGQSEAAVESVKVEETAAEDGSSEVVTSEENPSENTAEVKQVKGPSLSNAAVEVPSSEAVAPEENAPDKTLETIETQ